LIVHNDVTVTTQCNINVAWLLCNYHADINNYHGVSKLRELVGFTSLLLWGSLRAKSPRLLPQLECRRLKAILYVTEMVESIFGPRLGQDRESAL